MALKLKFFPPLALALCWMVVSNEAYSMDCTAAEAQCHYWYTPGRGGLEEAADACTGYKKLCQANQDKYAKAFVACMNRSDGDCNTTYNKDKGGPNCGEAFDACKGVPQRM